MIDHELESKGLRLVDEHINRVQKYLADVIGQLALRSANHDRSKLSPEELGLVLGKPAFDKYEYMSKEERAALEAVKESLVHHYANNRHHPEHYEDGIYGMGLLSLLIMAVDWKAAGEMSANGSYQQSIEFNTERFGLTPELVKVLENTGRELGWL